MEPPIPADALAAIEPRVRDLEEQLKPLFERLPEPLDCAIQFHVPEAP